MYRKYLDMEIPGHNMDDWKLGAKAVVRLRKELHMLVSFISHLAYYEGALAISDAAICPSDPCQSHAPRTKKCVSVSRKLSQLQQ